MGRSKQAAAGGGPGCGARASVTTGGLVVRFTIPCRVDVSLCFGYYSALSPQAIVKCTT
jgi:hypothetical protein